MLSVRDYLRIVQTRYRLILLCLLVAIGLSAVITLAQRPRYTAAAQVFISVSSAGDVADLSQGNTYVQQIVSSYALVATSPYVLEPVIRSLNIGSTASELAKSITVTSQANTVVLEVSVTSHTGADAARIANAITRQLAQSAGSLAPQGQDTSIRVTPIARAVAPESASSPRIALNIFLGALIGLLLGLVGALIADALDTRVRSSRAFGALLRAPVLGSIQFDKTAAVQPLSMISAPHGLIAEAYRTLRTNLRFTEFDSGRRSFVITSALPGEGKSTAASNLAISLSEAGRTVVVVDADLRRPSTAQKFGLDGGVGLTDFLIGDVSLDKALQQVTSEGPYVLPAGTVPPNPSELLQTGAMADLIRSLELRFEFVIFDTPPLLPVSDAALLARATAGALIVCAVGRARQQDVTAAVLALNRVGTRVIGGIATMVPSSGRGGYGYGYGYGYGGVVTNNDLPETDREHASYSTS